MHFALYVRMQKRFKVTYDWHPQNVLETLIKVYCFFENIFLKTVF